MRNLLVASLAVTLLLIGLFVTLLLPRPNPVNPASVGRVKEGMTLAEAEAAIGVPPGDYRTRPGRPFVLSKDVRWTRKGETRAAWMGDEAEVEVIFNDKGVASEVLRGERSPYDVDTIELARWRLERLWERLFP